MDRLSFKLAVVLGLQVVLALILWAGGPDYNAFKAKEPLLAFDPAKVDRIEIAEAGATPMALVKEDGKWTVPSFLGFPADGAKVSGLLTKLGDLKKGWPVASSAEAAKRFKVTDADYERRIVLKSGGSAVGEILLGTSPAFKQVSARASSDSHVYSVAFATYEAGTRGEDWLDRSSLNIPQDQIASIDVAGAILERKDGKFVLSGLEKDQKQDETATYRLIGALTFPAFDAVVGKGAEALAKVNDPSIVVTVKRTAGEPIVLKFKKEASGGAYLFTSSANGFLFRASEAAMEPIAKAKRETLIEAPKKAAAEAAGPAAEPVKLEGPKKAGDEAAQAATQPVKPVEAKKAQDEAAQAATQLAKPEEPKKAQDEGVQAATQPVKPEEPKKAQDEAAQAATQPAKPEEPKKVQDEAVQAVPAAEPKKAEDERFEAAIQPPLREEPKKAQDEGAGAEPKKAADEHSPAAAQPAKPEEPQDAAEGAAAAHPEKPAEPVPPSGG